MSLHLGYTMSVTTGRGMTSVIVLYITNCEKMVHYLVCLVCKLKSLTSIIIASHMSVCECRKMGGPQWNRSLDITKLFFFLKVFQGKETGILVNYVHGQLYFNVAILKKHI